MENGEGESVRRGEGEMKSRMKKGEWENKLNSIIKNVRLKYFAQSITP
jgi:hypothetical protein